MELSLSSTQMVGDRMKLAALRLLPKNAVSRAFGAVSDVPLPPGVRTAVNYGFAAVTGADVSESRDVPGAYRSLNEFFTRELQDGARPIESREPGAIVSPADGRIDQFGPIRTNTLVQAKGRTYRLVDLLDSGRDAARFVGGHYATIYLSPRDYHRVHSPAEGLATHIGYIPGYLFPVNPFAVEHIGQLFAVNERLATYLESDALGSVGVVMVGATCVGRMTLEFHSCQTNSAFRRREDLKLPEPVQLAHGDPFGVFNLGSTVIILVSNPEFTFDPTLRSGDVVRVGQLLGST